MTRSRAIRTIRARRKRRKAARQWAKVAKRFRRFLGKSYIVGLDPAVDAPAYIQRLAEALSGPGPIAYRGTPSHGRRARYWPLLPPEERRIVKMPDAPMETLRFTNRPRGAEGDSKS